MHCAVLGINSLNIDALYGLPLQTQSGLRDTLTQILSLKPDRIALFGYAHVPWMKKHQQMILEKTIPGLDERFAQARMAEKYLCENGYEQIGIDHFSLRNDSLEKANRSRTMKRNFQGLHNGRKRIFDRVRCFFYWADAFWIYSEYPRNCELYAAG